MIDPELSCSILENIENLLGVCHGDVKWFTSLLTLGGLGPLIISFLCVDGDRLGVVGVDSGRILCGGRCGGVWRTVAVAVATAVAIAFNISATSVARLVGAIFRVL